ncbi:MAG: LiaF transmembrane domain-containing protein [bacterium]
MKFTKESGVIMDERIEPEERREEDLNREEFRQKESPWRHTGSLTGALILIVVGIVFLLDNAWGIKVGNWWALIILIPAFAAFARAWSVYRAKSRFTYEASSSLTGGLILALVAFIFLFSLDWGKVWPAFLIVLGLGALLGAMLRR